METMKEMFRDALQQVMESELETEFGYKKVSGRRIPPSKMNQRIIGTDTRKRQSKRSWARLKSRFRGTATGALNRKSSASMTGTPTAWKKRSAGGNRLAE